MRAWVVRAGRNSERERDALLEGMVIAGWGELGDISQAHTREDIRTALSRAYPEESSRVLGNWTGQLFRFREEIQHGDLVVLPLSSRRVALGKVSGPYRYRADANEELRHVRPVDWLRTDVDRSAFRQDLLDSMGSLLTVFELTRNDAAARIAAVAATGTDPQLVSLPADAADRPGTPSKLFDEVEQRRPEDPLRMTVRDFLAIWDAPRRWSAVVDQIRADLDRMGLATRPSFTEGSLDSEISVIAIGEAPSTDRSGPVESPQSETEDDQDLIGTPLAYRISNIPSAQCAMVTVRLSDSLITAVTKMIGSRCTQLPVLDDAGQLRGVISWESVGRARMSSNDPTLQAATAPALAAALDDDLLRWIPEIRESGYVFVRDHDLRVCGIVTTADLTLQFETRVRPLVLLEEVEQRLRRSVDERFNLDEIRRAARGRRPEDVHSAAALNFGNYQHLLRPSEHWGRLGWHADHEIFLEQLDHARQVRNNLMHFSPDPVTPEQLAPVQGLLDLLRSLDPRS